MVENGDILTVKSRKLNKVEYPFDDRLEVTAENPETGSPPF